MNILKILIDYSLFDKYDKDYFIKNIIIPIYEDSISLKIAICSNSNLNSIKDDFIKVINFVDAQEADIMFILSNLENRLRLYKLAQMSTLQNSFEKFTSQFLDELIIYAIEQRASDIHIERFKELALFKFRIDGRLKIFFSFEAEFSKIISSFVKLISNLDITQVRNCLEGRFTRYIKDTKYDFRLSTSLQNF